MMRWIGLLAAGLGVSLLVGLAIGALMRPECATCHQRRTCAGWCPEDR